ncbi:MAG: HD-GYP domain-containing protein, partial [Oscillospiraceae bacterium]
IRRTSEVVRIFSEKLLHSDMDFDPQFLELVIRSAPMHDLGKIGVDDAILRKQSRFTDEEYSKMKVHSEMGAEIVRKVLTDVEEKEFVEVASNVAHYHHEKVNGKGYPDGLAGDQIPVEARIMALADVFDALVSKRCYKEAFSFDKAFEIIKNDSGSHFDTRLTEVFLQCRPELEQFYSSDV